MPRDDDQRIYRTFEEFEREEIRRMDAAGASVDELLEDLFTDELDFDPASGRRGRVVAEADTDTDDEEE